MAHRIAMIQDISPWDALLLAVKRAAAWAAFYDMKLGEVENDDDLGPNGPAHHWLESAKEANEKLARWSKMAVDAGVQAIMVQQAQTGGAVIARALNTALGSVQLDRETEMALRAALQRALLDISQEQGAQAAALEGAPVDGS